MRLTAALVLVSALAAATAASAQTNVGRRSPQYSAQTPDGKTLSLASYQGRVVLLAFINTECPHCQKISAMMARLQASRGNDEVQPMAVAINANAGKLIPFFIERTGISFPVALDTQSNVRKYLGIPNTGVVMPPVLVVIDPQGTIKAEYGGDDPTIDDERGMAALIEKLTARTQAPAEKP